MFSLIESWSNTQGTDVGVEVQFYCLAHRSHDAGDQEGKIASLVDVQYRGQRFLLLLVALQGLCVPVGGPWYVLEHCLTVVATSMNEFGVSIVEQNSRGEPGDVISI